MGAHYCLTPFEFRSCAPSLTVKLLTHLHYIKAPTDVRSVADWLSLFSGQFTCGTVSHVNIAQAAEGGRLYIFNLS